VVAEKAKHALSVIAQMCFTGLGILGIASGQAMSRKFWRVSSNFDAHSAEGLATDERLTALQRPCT
jgi:hypothetical protein